MKQFYIFLFAFAFQTFLWEEFLYLRQESELLVLEGTRF